MPPSSQSLQYWDRLLQPIREALSRPAGRAILAGVHGAMLAFALTVLGRTDRRSFLMTMPLCFSSSSPPVRAATGKA